AASCRRRRSVSRASTAHCRTAGPRTCDGTDVPSMSMRTMAYGGQPGRFTQIADTTVPVCGVTPCHTPPAGRRQAPVGHDRPLPATAADAPLGTAVLDGRADRLLERPLHDRGAGFLVALGLHPVDGLGRAE